jgi:hypothetical protein
MMPKCYHKACHAVKKEGCDNRATATYDEQINSQNLDEVALDVTKQNFVLKYSLIVYI